MFKNNDEGYENTQHAQPDDTIIGSTIKIEGDLVSNGNIIVEGEVLGSLKTEKSLRVGPEAKVKADIKASEALISGTVEGNVVIDGKLQLTETAVVNGDIKAKVLSIEPGAVFNGSCSMEGGVDLVEKKIENNDEEDDSE